jgi:N-acetylglutamate synthase-like GNAT family acetyltransferase
MLRRAREIEAPDVHVLLWSAKHDIPLVEAFHTDRYLHWVADRCKNKVVWVVTLKSKITGVMIMQENEIFYLVVSTENRRKGTGRMLVKKAKTLYKEQGVKARVSPANIPVVKLLAAEGFRCDGVIPGMPGSISESWIGYSWS